MRPNSKTLALRDPAAAILMGAIDGADFGAEYGYDFGDDEHGDDYGDDYGADYSFGAAAPARHPAHPPAALAAKLWAQHKARTAHTDRRARLIEPNKGSSVKIERYSFAINAALVLGTPANLNMFGQPDTNIRPQRVTMNAPSPGFATIQEIKVANVSVTVGGTSDAWDYNSLGVGQSLDMPTLTPANRAQVLGAYTGFVPPGFVGGSAYTFCCSFKGPASIVA
jgi:hypothetical protein